MVSYGFLYWFLILIQCTAGEVVVSGADVRVKVVNMDRYKGEGFKWVQL